LIRTGNFSALAVVAMLIIGLSSNVNSAAGGHSTTTPAANAGTALPAGSDLDADAATNPREVFHSETLRGRRSYMSNLGNLAFNSPYTLGDTARKAHISCASCHVNGASNPKLFIPGLSTRPGNFDTSNALFNPKTDNGVLDPLTIPSLRGARFLAPYGHDGRTASLRDFVRNVVVNEFAGAEPSAEILDAMVTYIEDIDFLPNPKLDPTGHLGAGATPSQRHGEALFRKPFPNDPDLSCATCHVPSEAFVDHRQHDIGSGGLFKTPTLLNANFAAPYFHDGRFDNFDQVMEHFNRVYALGLSTQDRTDLADYLAAVGDGVQPAYRLTGLNVLADINGFVSVLDIAVARHDTQVIVLATKSGRDLLQDLAGHYAESIGAANSAGAQERALARSSISTLVQILQRISSAADTGRYADAAADYLNYRKLSFATVPLALQTAERWSQFTQ
jgi:Di-haem cytochrome c peroxidase